MKEIKCTHSAPEVSNLTGMRNPLKTAHAPPIKRSRSPPEPVVETDTNYKNNEKESKFYDELIFEVSRQ